MRTTAAIAAGTIVLAAAPFASAEEPLEQLLIDVTASHNSHSETLAAQQEDIDAAEESGDDEALVEAQDAYRATLKEWRTDLIDASDDLRELREDAEQEAEESGTPLSKEDKEAFTEAADAIKEDRKTVRELRTEVLGDDEAVCLPGLVAGDTGLGGLLGTTAMDAVERSEQGDKRIAFDCSPESTHATTEVKRAEEPTTVAGSTEASTSTSAEPEATEETEATEEPNMRYRAKRPRPPPPASRAPPAPQRPHPPPARRRRRPRGPHPARRAPRAAHPRARRRPRSCTTARRRRAPRPSRRPLRARPAAPAPPPPPPRKTSARVTSPRPARRCST